MQYVRSLKTATSSSKPTSKETTQQFCLRETDPNSPRKSKLKSTKPEIMRVLKRYVAREIYRHLPGN